MKIFTDCSKKYVVFRQKIRSQHKTITCQKLAFFCQPVKHMAKVKSFSLIFLEVFIFNTGRVQINDNLQHVLLTMENISLFASNFTGRNQFW